MTIEAIVLLVLGIIFLLVGWKAQNTEDKDKIVYLKGLATIKKDMNHLQKELKVLNEKVNYAIGMNAYSQQDRPKESMGDILQEHNDQYTVEEYVAVQEYQPEREFTEIYNKVISLTAEGLSKIEIADRLSLSQDAVAMVLSTYSGANKKEVTQNEE